MSSSYRQERLVPASAETAQINVNTLRLQNNMRGKVFTRGDYIAAVRIALDLERIVRLRAIRRTNL